MEELPGANTQGDTLEEARENLREAVALILEANRELAEQSLVKIALEWDDQTFKEAGKVGMWTKADSVTLFDDFSYSER